MEDSESHVLAWDLRPDRLERVWVPGCWALAPHSSAVLLALCWLGFTVSCPGPHISLPLEVQTEGGAYGQAGLNSRDEHVAAAINNDGRLTRFQRQIIYCAPVLRQCCRGRPACRGAGGWRSRSWWTKLPHQGRHGTVPGRGDCTISTPHPGPCSRSKSITTHLVLGCKASSSRHHLGLASWTQAHKHRSTGKKMQGWGRQSSRGKVHLQTDCPPASPVQPRPLNQRTRTYT